MRRKLCEFVPVLISSSMELILYRRACVWEPLREAALCGLAPCIGCLLGQATIWDSFSVNQPLRVLVPAWRNLLGELLSELASL